MKRSFLDFLFAFAIGAASLSDGAEPGSRSNTGAPYDVAAFVWPSYHPDDRARIFWPMGMGEWETVMKNKPKFEGHEQDRQPLWGYVKENDPYVMEMQINAAADHGVNVFIFDWYWYDGMPYLESHLNDGYLGARNNDRVKFYIMWANHDVGLVWDIRNSDDTMTKKNNAKIWKGRVDRDEFEIVGRRFIERYFSHPSYYRIDGKPVLNFYDLPNLIAGLGGIAGTRDALRWLRDQAVAAGHPGLELQACLRRAGRKVPTGLGSDDVALQQEVVDQLGLDSVTHYQFVHFVDVNRDFLQILPDVRDEWTRMDESYPIPYYAHVSVGWDNNPRSVGRHGSIVTNDTPENVARAFALARDYVDAHPDQVPLITVNSWNEWTETSYLQPDTLYGYGYLEAVGDVFLRTETAEDKR